MQEHLELLGWKVSDRVTGYTGVVTHVGLDLYGCVQALVQPASITKESGIMDVPDQRWMDVSRLEKYGRGKVMNPIPQKGDLLVAGSGACKPVK